jgi:hypothetical protein
VANIVKANATRAGFDAGIRGHRLRAGFPHLGRRTLGLYDDGGSRQRSVDVLKVSKAMSAVPSSSKSTRQRRFFNPPWPLRCQRGPPVSNSGGDLSGCPGLSVG